MVDQVQESQPGGKQPTTKDSISVSPRWRDRILAASIWSAVVYLNSGLLTDFPPPELVRLAFSASHRWWRWMLYSLSLLLLAFRLGFWRSIWFALYFLVFPFWLPVLLVIKGSKALFRIVGLNIGVLKFLSSPRAAASLFLFLPVVYLVIAETSNERALVLAIVTLLFVCMRTLFGVVRWVFRPLNSFTNAIEWALGKYNAGLKAETFNIDLSADQSSPKAKEARTAIDGARNVVKGLRWIRMTCVTEKSLLAVFLSVLLATLALTVTNFGYIYYGIYKLNPSNLTGVTEHARIWEFLYFSMNVMSTSDLSPILPIGPFTRVVTVVELLSALVLLSLLFVVFSTVGQGDLTRATQAIDRLLSDQIQRVSKWETSLNIAPAEGNTLGRAGGAQV